MKVKNLLKIALPILSTTTLVVPAVSCSKTTSAGFDIVHKDGSKTHYETFEKALAALKSDDSIEFNGDAVITKSLELKSVNGVTINGNGHSLLLESQVNDLATHVASFNGCKNLKLSNLHIAGNASVGLTFLNSTVTMDGVVASGAYTHVVEFNEKSGGTISNCSFQSLTGNENFDYTISLSSDTTNPVTIENTIADSVYVDGTEFANKRVEFKEGNNIRFIAVDIACSKENFKKGVVGYENIETLWFGGGLATTSSGDVVDYPIWYSSLTVQDNKSAFFILNVTGFYLFNGYYRRMLPSGASVEVHLMDNIDCSSPALATTGWQPLDTWTSKSIPLFDGHGYTVSNLKIDFTGFSNPGGVGLFSLVGDTTVRNVTFDNCRLEIIDAGNVGFVFGNVRGRAVLDNVTVSNTYIGGKQKVGSLVGVVDDQDGISSEDPEDIKAWITLSHCTSDNCSVVNKATGGGSDVDVYLGGLIGWVAYHFITGPNSWTNRGYIIIDDDPAKPTTLKNIHFNWQQDSEQWDTNFEVALLFLYSHPYRQCNSYVNVNVEYRDE